jgi:hypothetical protein
LKRRSDGRLTGAQKIFVERYVSTNDAAYAAEKAGYAHPRIAGNTFLQRPNVKAAIHEQITERSLKAIGIGLGRIEQFLLDAKTSPREVAALHKEARQTYFDFNPKAAGADDDDLSGLSLAELGKRASQLEAQAKALRVGAMTIDGDVVNATIDDADDTESSVFE